MKEKEAGAMGNQMGNLLAILCVFGTSILTGTEFDVFLLRHCFGLTGSL